MLLYLDYMCTTIRPDGLISYGLGDWLHAGRQADDAKSPTEFVNTVLSMDICEKAAYMFGELDLEEQKQFALGIYARLRRAAREHLIDTNTMTALGRCQTSQARAIFYSLFEPAEKPEAIRRLVELVHEQDDHMDVGIVGAQVLFHVLSEGGYGELTYEMIVRPDFPSYGQWLEGDATTLREWVWPEDRDSLNHHFRGDISHWFIRRLAGIHYNPRRNGKELDIKPDFIKQLDFASGWHLAPEGKISVNWTRNEEGVLLEIEAPAGLSGRIILPKGYVFAADGMAYRPLWSGSYQVRKMH